MIEFRIRTNGQVVTEAEFRASHDAVFPQVITKEIAEAFGVDVIVPCPPPPLTSKEAAYRVGETQDEAGNWTYVWKVRSRDPDIVAAELVMLKEEKRRNINSWRERENFTTFPYAGKLISCDTLSRSDIDGVANHISLFGTFPNGFKNAWKTADNGYVLIPDIDSFKAMYKAMADQGTKNFDRAQALKQIVEQAETAEELYVLKWEENDDEPS